MFDLSTTGDTQVVTGPTNRSFLDALEHDCSPFQAVLQRAPWRAAAWELPPLTLERLDAPFECVLVDSPPLARAHPEPQTFASHYGEGSAVRFANLRGDSELIAPVPRGDRPYTHLLAWARSADPDEAQALWALVAAAVRERLSDRALWLSTSGLGVHWLHVRLDPAPKYYVHQAYRLRC